ncbi:DUF4249 domain-containing protein [Flavobacterium sharifuzzamanii]|uniref:DUF4249 domain-containing protein n=1 Tax=Flavobacterium sharifuzzamanii TaxID=2211133 RepID=UPI000DAB815C|nr:DUF4249 domain-containing protein [Flavobacterium sharifuzzamanii]KAF2081967.1 DUF4249 domain-containing protein [Flavobacterium sharifuzzamanii]
MRKLVFFIVFFTSLFFTSCEEVVDVDLDTAPPRLVIEASINWEKGTTGNEQIIKLTTTTGYFENSIPTVSGAIVYIKDSHNEQFNFIEIKKTGQYSCINFKPVVGEQYTLTVISRGSRYIANETLKSVAPITRIEQKNDGGFTGKDIEIKSYFTDPGDEENYYLFKYVYSSKVTSNYYVSEDKFYQGNEIYSVTDDEDLKAGDEILVTHYGISKQYYNYMNILVSIAGTNVGGPFQSPPATVKGNIVNVTNKDNYPLGYFSLSETSTKKYKIE